MLCLLYRKHITNLLKTHALTGRLQGCAKPGLLGEFSVVTFGDGQ